VLEAVCGLSGIKNFVRSVRPLSDRFADYLGLSLGEGGPPGDISRSSRRFDTSRRIASMSFSCRRAGNNVQPASVASPPSSPYLRKRFLSPISSSASRGCDLTGARVRVGYSLKNRIVIRASRDCSTGAHAGLQRISEARFAFCLHADSLKRAVDVPLPRLAAIIIEGWLEARGKK